MVVSSDTNKETEIYISKLPTFRLVINFSALTYGGAVIVSCTCTSVISSGGGLFPADSVSEVMFYSAQVCLPAIAQTGEDDVRWIAKRGHQPPT